MATTEASIAARHEEAERIPVHGGPWGGATSDRAVIGPAQCRVGMIPGTTPVCGGLAAVLEAGAMGDEAGSTRVLVADDHPVYLDGLAAAIERTADLSSWRRAATAPRRCTGSGPTGPRRRARPAMPGLSTPAILEEFAAAGLPCRVLILSVHLEGDEIHECLSLGAPATSPRTRPRGDLRRDPGHRGRPYGPVGRGDDEHGGRAPAASHGRSRPPHAPRERDPRHARRRRLRPDIAARLQLSTATVKTHLHNLYVKLDVSDRAAAVAEGMRRGLIR